LNARLKKKLLLFAGCTTKQTCVTSPTDALLDADTGTASIHGAGCDNLHRLPRTDTPSPDNVGAIRSAKGSSMLSREENELLCRVGPGTAMGRTIRMYWIPALLSH
jgi:hypothetical protein